MNSKLLRLIITTDGPLNLQEIVGADIMALVDKTTRSDQTTSRTSRIRSSKPGSSRSGSNQASGSKGRTGLGMDYFAPADPSSDVLPVTGHCISSVPRPQPSTRTQLKRLNRPHVKPKTTDIVPSSPTPPIVEAPVETSEHGQRLDNDPITSIDQEEQAPANQVNSNTSENQQVPSTEDRLNSNSPAKQVVPSTEDHGTNLVLRYRQILAEKASSLGIDLDPIEEVDERVASPMSKSATDEQVQFQDRRRQSFTVDIVGQAENDARIANYQPIIQVAQYSDHHSTARSSRGQTPLR